MSHEHDIYTARGSDLYGRVCLACLIVVAIMLALIGGLCGCTHTGAISGVPGPHLSVAPEIAAARAGVAASETHAAAIEGLVRHIRVVATLPAAAGPPLDDINTEAGNVHAANAAISGALTTAAGKDTGNVTQAAATGKQLAKATAEAADLKSADAAHLRGWWRGLVIAGSLALIGALGVTFLAASYPFLAAAKPFTRLAGILGAVALAVGSFGLAWGWILPYIGGALLLGGVGYYVYLLRDDQAKATAMAAQAHKAVVQVVKTAQAFATIPAGDGAKLREAALLTQDRDTAAIVDAVKLDEALPGLPPPPRPETKHIKRRRVR